MDLEAPQSQLAPVHGAPRDAQGNDSEPARNALRDGITRRGRQPELVRRAIAALGNYVHCRYAAYGVLVLAGPCEWPEGHCM